MHFSTQSDTERRVRGSAFRREHQVAGALLGFLALGGCANAGTLVTVAPGEICGAKVGSAQSAIVNGSLTSDFPAVGMMQTTTGGLCTGVLIHPRIVLLAAHCIEGESNFRFDFGDSDTTVTRSVPVVEAVKHPRYSASGLDYDLGYLVLSEEVTDVPPVQIDLNQQAVGTPFTLVGYGQTDGSGAGSGTKRTATGTISHVTDSGIPTMWAFQYAPGGVCSGDSGGPALQLRGSQWFTIGVANLANTGCVGEGNYARFDVQRDFLMQATAAGATAPPPTQPQPMMPATPGCSNTCVHANDGECDDGGPGAMYQDCELGTDCADCGARGEETPTPDPGMPSDPNPNPGTPSDPGMNPGTPPPVHCSNECPHAYDGQCDDGGPGSMCSICTYGTDCADCGAR